MRKIFFLCIVFFLPCYLFASKTSFTFSGGKETRNLVMNVNTNNLRYISTLNQDKDGKFKLSVPPSFNFHTNTGFVMGELKIGGIFAFSLSPDGKDIFSAINQKNIKEVFTPSLNPKYSGMAKNFENLTVAVTNPLFNRESPLGIMVAYKTNNMFFSVIKLNKSLKQNDSIKLKYQVNWKDIGLFNSRYYLLAGVNSDLTVGSVKIRTAGFSDSIFDTDFGFRGYYGCEVKVDSKFYLVTFKAGYNSSGSNKEAQQTFDVGFKIKKDTELSLSYKNELFPLPIYGGTSQKRVITFQNELKYSVFKFKAKHTYTVEETTGHTCISVYSFNAGSFVVDKNYFSLRSEVTLGREETLDTYVKKFSLTVRDRYSKLEFSGEKTYLTLSWETYINIVKIKASVTQNRVFTISASVNY